MDKVQKSSNSESYTPSSEPFRWEISQYLEREVDSQGSVMWRYYNVDTLPAEFNCGFPAILSDTAANVQKAHPKH
jgi:hypothetical protein